MKRLLLIAIVVAISSPLYALSARVDGNISLVVRTDGTASSYSWAQYYNSLGFAMEIYIQGDHGIRSTTGATVDRLQWGSYSGSYAGTRQGPIVCGNDYQAQNHGQAYPFGAGSNDFVPGGPWTASGASSPCPTPPPTTPTPSTACDTDCPSPIVIDLGGTSSYRLSGVDDPVSFDIDGDGSMDQLAWTERGSGVAFLALDRNADGRITHGGELFGDATRTLSGNVAANGFEALRSFDSDQNGVIDLSDPVWPQLVLWVDANHDGDCQAGELLDLARTDVVALGLNYRWIGRHDRHGNAFRWAARLVRTNHREQSYYDVYFSR